MRVLLLPAILAVGCASGTSGGNLDGGGDDDGDGGVTNIDGSCGDICDQDSDGVLDATDECANTPGGADVNDVGCSDDQVDPALADVWPPFGLTWTATGDPGRAGGMVWDYAGIDHADLFHIYWIVCDDPATPCGLSLDGPIDDPAEEWVFDAADSSLGSGRVVFSNSTHILLADATSPQLYGRLVVQIFDDTNTTFPFATVGTLGVTARDGTHGAEIISNGYHITVLIEVEDNSLVWTPYLDYYDAQPTPDTGGTAAVSFGGSFYSE